MPEANIANYGETVLGHVPSYIDKAQAKGVNYFDIGDAWADLIPDQGWAANTNFLNKIAGYGDKVNFHFPRGKSDLIPILQEKLTT